MRKTIQILLFIISYAPLYLILFFQNMNDKIYNQEGIFLDYHTIIKNNHILLSFLILIIVSISLFFLLFKIVLKISTVKLKVEKIRDYIYHIPLEFSMLFIITSMLRVANKHFFSYEKTACPHIKSVGDLIIQY